MSPGKDFLFKDSISPSFATPQIRVIYDNFRSSGHRERGAPIAYKRRLRRDRRGPLRRRSTRVGKRRFPKVGNRALKA